MLTIYNNSNNQIIHSCFKFIQGPLLLITSCHLSAVHSQNKCTNVQIITSKRKCKSCFCLVHVRICWPHLDLFTIEASKYPWAGKISSARLIMMPPLPLLPSPADSSWFYSFKAFMLKQKHRSSPSFFPPPFTSLLLCLPRVIQRNYNTIWLLLYNLSRKTSGALCSFPPMSQDDGGAEVVAENRRGESGQGKASFFRVSGRPAF